MGWAAEMRLNGPFPLPSRHSDADAPLVLLAVVILAGALGYHQLSHLGTLDAFYMAITTLFTVGFREMGDVNAYNKVFTIFYLIVGLGVATYALSNLTALLLEGDLRGYLMERRMLKRLDDLKDHVIVCGFGKMGFQAAWELKKAGVPFVIIEQDETKGRSPRFSGELILYGNAMDDLTLERAGVRHARGLITALTTDADHVLVTLTVKQIRPDMPLVGQTLREARLRHATGALLVGLVHPGAGLRFNPSGDERFQAGDEILIMGPADALETLTRLAEGKV